MGRASRPRGSVGIAAFLCRWQTAGGGSILRWSASKTQNRRPAERQRARTKKSGWDERRSMKLYLSGLQGMISVVVHSQGLSHPYHPRHVKWRDNIRVDVLYWTFCFGWTYFFHFIALYCIWRCSSRSVCVMLQSFFDPSTCRIGWRFHWDGFFDTKQETNWDREKKHELVSHPGCTVYAVHCGNEWFRFPRHSV